MKIAVYHLRKCYFSMVCNCYFVLSGGFDTSRHVIHIILFFFPHVWRHSFPIFPAKQIVIGEIIVQQYPTNLASLVTEHPMGYNIVNLKLLWRNIVTTQSNDNKDNSDHPISSSTNNDYVAEQTIVTSFLSMILMTSLSTIFSMIEMEVSLRPLVRLLKVSKLNLGGSRQCRGAVIDDWCHETYLKPIAHILVGVLVSIRGHWFLLISARYSSFVLGSWCYYY